MSGLPVGRDTVVTLELVLADFWGNVLQESAAPVQYLHGGYGDLLPALERALEGRRAGDRVTIRLEPEEAFGEYDESLLRVEPRASFPATLDLGMQFEGVPGSPPDDAIYTVTDIAADKVVLDGNHALAGIGLEFRCAVREVRPATAAEIERGGSDGADPPVFRVLTH